MFAPGTVSFVMVVLAMLGGSAAEYVTYGGFVARLSEQTQHFGEVDSDYPEGTARSPS